MKYTNILTLILLFKVLPIKAQEVKFSLGRFLNFESARLTVLPKYAPLIHSPYIKKMEVMNTINKEKIPFYNNVDGVFGIDWHYYAPNSRLTFGCYTDFAREQLTILDKIHPTFTTNTVQLRPYLHFKTGDFTKLVHIDMNAGFNAIFAFNRSAVYYENGATHSLTGIRSLNKFRSELFIGGGVTIDLLELDQNEAWLKDRMRLVTFGIQWNFPIPFAEATASNFFTKSTIQTNDNKIDKSYPYRSYSAAGSYFTFTLGTKIDLFRWDYISNWNNPVLKNKKMIYLFHPPVYFKEPIRDYFGGFHIDMSLQWALDTVNYQANGIASRHAFRNALNYCVGYNFHFLGNYDLDKSGNNSRYSTSRKNDIFVGVQLTNRNFVLQNELGERYHVTSIGGDIGGRIGYKDFYGLLGAELDYNFINERQFMQGRSTGKSFLKPISYGAFVGLSYRNILSIKLKKNPLFSIAQEPFSFRQLECWVGMGF
jgi:hypothetical protein